MTAPSPTRDERAEAHAILRGASYDEAVAKLATLLAERDAAKADYADTAECLRNERKKADEIISKLRAEVAAMRPIVEALAKWLNAMEAMDGKRTLENNRRYTEAHLALKHAAETLVRE